LQGGKEAGFPGFPVLPFWSSIMQKNLCVPLFSGSAVTGDALESCSVLQQLSAANGVFIGFSMPDSHFCKELAAYNHTTDHAGRQPEAQIALQA
jgi:hypothetical protein